MKKIIQIVLISIFIGFYSCDMDQYPYDKLATDESLETLLDFKTVRNGLYSGMKSRNTGSYILCTEIQSDGFHAVNGFSNTYGPHYRWEFETSDGDLENQWAGFYGTINNANLLISGIDTKITGFAEADQVILKQYRSEACFMRAFAYYELTRRFCLDYEPSSADKDWGVPVVTTYAPTSISSKYPPRNTMLETYKQILDDIKDAETGITAAGAPLSAYVTVDVIQALKARVALQMHAWDDAIGAATSLINSGRYPLIDQATAYKEMWLRDNGSEAIWQIAFDINDLGNATGSYFIGDDLSPKPDYIPESGIIALYDKTNDIRFGAYFQEKQITTPGGSDKVYLCYKYPGNPTLYTGKSNFVNMPKVFRIAEMYLIAAEAYSQKGGSDALASSYLNLLKSKRIEGWATVSYSGTGLMKEIQDERRREMFGEGQRMTDLKRWGLGVERSVAQNVNLIQLPGSSLTEKLSKAAKDTRFIWAIPKAETDANPQIKPQQNPGY